MNTRQFCSLAALWTAVAASPAMAADEPAREAVSAAEKAVAEAASQRALWTSAEDALRRARGALESGDGDAAKRWAATAAEQARLGLAQKQYPPNPNLTAR